MSGPFKIEVVFRRSVYALGIETARDLLAGLERASRRPPAAAALRDDLRSAIARHDAGPGEEAEGSRQPAAGSRQSDGSDRSDAPRCWFCDAPGVEMSWTDGRPVHFVCRTTGCVREGIATERAEFQNGAK